MKQIYISRNISSRLSDRCPMEAFQMTHADGAQKRYLHCNFPFPKSKLAICVCCYQQTQIASQKRFLNFEMGFKLQENWINSQDPVQMDHFGEKSIG